MAMVAFDPAAGDYWEVTCRDRYRGSELLQKLAALLPPGLTLYIEGTSIAPLVTAYLKARRAANPPSVKRATIWPAPRTYHMPLTPENVNGLVELMNGLAQPEVADHIHAYRGSEAFLIWYDAWFDTPFYLRTDVPEDAVRRLCSDLGCEYGVGS